MSAVVLRCPHCGTTRATPGECEACHEATVRYYCTDHSPGRWLDSPRCPSCGAAFDDAPRAPAPHAAPRPPAVRPRADAGRGTIGTPAPSRRPPLPAPPATSRRPTVWPPREVEDRATIEAGTWERVDREPPPVEVELAPAGRALRGCLLRLVMLAVLAILGLFGVISLLGGSLLRLIAGY